MRLLERAEQQHIISDLKNAWLGSTLTSTFGKELDIQVISGEDEGFWGYLAVNKVSGSIKNNLVQSESQALASMVDLGGQSFQVATPLERPQGEFVTRDSTYIRSFLGFGADAVQAKLGKVHSEACQYVQGRPAIKAAGCRTALRVLLCPAGHCELGDQRPQALKGPVKVVSLAFYAWNAVMKLMKGTPGELHSWPTPSLAEMALTADAFCAIKRGELQGRAKGDTELEFNLEDRCFHVNYIIVLLHHVLGVAEGARNITILKDIDGQSIDWPLGAFLEGGTAWHQADFTGDVVPTYDMQRFWNMREMVLALVLCTGGVMAFYYLKKQQRWSYKALSQEPPDDPVKDIEVAFEIGDDDFDD